MREPVIFENKNQRLVGIFHRPEGPGPFPTVCFYHGFTGTKSEAHRIFVTQAEELAKRGIASFRFDFRGSGDSEGDFAEMTFTSELSDAYKALDYLGSRSDVSALAVLGLSMGGAIAATVLGDVSTLKAGVLWSPVGNFMDCYIGDSLKELAKGGFPINWGGNLVGKGFAEDIVTHKPFEGVKKAQAPVLIIHGTEDQAVQTEQSYEYARILEQVGAEHKLHIVEGADHCYCSKDWKNEVIKTTADFLEKKLIKA